MSKPKAKKLKVPVAPPLPRPTRCFRCDGTGEICNNCGESPEACECDMDGDGADFGPCEDCKGTGE